MPTALETQTDLETQTALETQTDAIVCHCLQISAAEINAAARTLEVPSIRCIMKCTGAGTGCTACHRRIRQVLAGQCPSGSSPTCVMR